MDDKKMQGALFLNDKDGNESRPDFRGKLTLDDDRVLKVSAWKNVSKDGKPYLSCKCDWSDETANTTDVKTAWASVDMESKKEEPQTAPVETTDEIPF